MTETVDQRRARTDREAAAKTLPARVVSIDRASGDLLTILERLAELIADSALLAANRESTLSNIEHALEHARTIRGALD